MTRVLFVAISFQAEHFGTFLLLKLPCAEGGVAQSHPHLTAEDIWRGYSPLPVILSRVII